MLPTNTIWFKPSTVLTVKGVSVVARWYFYTVMSDLVKFLRPT